MESQVLDVLKAIASQFEIGGVITSITPLGEGNVNETYQVTCQETILQDKIPQEQLLRRYVMQRINTVVFPRPELVMANINVLANHVASRPLDKDWVMPTAIPIRNSGQTWLEREGQTWRMLTFVENAETLQTIKSSQEAQQVGRALGVFHHLVNDIPADALADTLPGFHVTPGYFQTFKNGMAEALANPHFAISQELEICLNFVNQRAGRVDVLEAALARGELKTRPIHGDPKVNNVMLCSTSGRALAMIDLDTVKPGLLHYDIGDCCRSGCNRQGEETEDLDAVVFDLSLCEAILEGYLSAAKETLNNHDFDYIVDAIHLITFELGLRFLTDHLAGNVYFKVNRPDHNLHRAKVQFKLVESIEQQEGTLRAIVERLRP
uniref:phosphotransferase enzyme family protein n=1 Tax=Cyanobium sp. TaxID=2164130 RepID=UPI0040477ADE